MRKVLFLSLLLIAVYGLVAVPASASDFEFFNMIASGGTITNSGGDYIGSNIDLDTLDYLGTDLAVTGGPDGAGVLNFDTTAGTWQVDGAVSAVGFPYGEIAGGTITSFSVDGCGSTDTFCDVLFSSLADTFNGLTWSGYSMTGGAGTKAGGPFVGNSSSDLAANIPATPEPASLALLGSGLIAIGGFARRKLTK